MFSFDCRGGHKRYGTRCEIVWVTGHRFRLKTIRRSSMNSEKEGVPSGQSGVSSEDSEPDLEERAPLSVRNARRMRRDWWPSIWITLASILILAAALAVLSYRMGAQSCH
jgi:hypothetical protein